MNASSTSNSIFVQSPTALQSQQSSPTTAGVDSDGDGQRTHRGHRGSGMGEALMQALGSLGLSFPQDGTASSSASASSSDADSSADSGTSAASGNVKSDMRQFMHALFQAVRSEDASASGGTAATASTGATADGKPDFAGGLASLISQVSSGSAPAALQSAFDKLSADLQPAGTTSSATAGTGSTTSASATLQTLLQQFQQNLGYGATSASAAVGNLMSAVA